jgi:cytochrome P450
VKNAFRPFELGARNCIGQELAQMELRIILALTLREFEFESAYEKGGPQLFGDLGYQILLPGMLTGRPKDDMPMRVRVRNEKSG